MNEAKQTETVPSGPKCPQCGASLPAGVLAGLCPACLLQQGAAADTATAGPTPPFTPPTVAELAALFPQLEILEFIGKGGMGAVYKARQKQLDRLVALKILPPGVNDEPAFAERFAREARALAKLNHPGIVTLYEFGVAAGVSPAVEPGVPPGGRSVAGSGRVESSVTDPGGKMPPSTSGGTPDATPASGSQPSTLNPQPSLYYFLMEFVDGVNLRQLLQSGRVSPREALAIVPQICDALQFAHDQGIVHRDIKPENILLDRRGRVKVADFGLAKIVGTDAPLTPSLSPSDGERVAARPGEGTPALTDAGKVMGTPNYMAPEQVSHPAEVDHRADIYALGVVFYQMLTGELPGKTIAPPSTKVLIDVRLDEVVLRALEKKPELRYQQVSEVKTCVETIVGTADAGSSRREEAQTEKSEIRNPKSEITAHFSRTAIVGACCLALTVLAVAGALLAASQSIALVLQTPNLPQLPQQVLDQGRAIHLVAILSQVFGAICALAGTTLGWIAISQIRRSNGKIRGLGLAMFDGLLFPLLALIAVLWIVWFSLLDWGFPQLQMLRIRKPSLVFSLLVLLPWFASSVLLCVWVAKQVWRAVNKPLPDSTPGDRGHESAPTESESLAESQRRREEAQTGKSAMAPRFPRKAIGFGFASLCFLVATVFWAMKAGANWDQGVNAIHTVLNLAAAIGFAVVAFKPGRPALLASGARSIHRRSKLEKAWVPLAFFAMVWALCAGMFDLTELWRSGSPVRAATAVAWLAGAAMVGVAGFKSIGRGCPGGKLLKGMCWLFAALGLGAWLAAPHVRDDVIRGVVSDAVTGKPIPGAIITVLRPDPTTEQAVRHTKTDANGAYRLVIPEGADLLYTEADGVRHSVSLWFQASATGYETMGSDQPLGTGLGERLLDFRLQPKGNEVKPAAVFGPVIERIVTDTINLDDGSLMEFPSTSSTNINVGLMIVENIRLAELKGVDAHVEGSSLLVLGMTLAPLPQNDWDSPNAVQIAYQAILSASATDKPPLVKLHLEKDGARTYAFKTREGGKGVLQITGSTDNPPGVKLRYKLVQTTTLSFGPVKDVSATTAREGDIAVHLDSPGRVESSNSVSFAIPEGYCQDVIQRFDAHQALTVEAYNPQRERFGHGLLTWVDNRIDPDTATLKCRASLIPEGENLMVPGLFLIFRLVLEVKHGVTLVPAEAILRDAQGEFVWAIKPDQTVSRRPVQMGTRDREMGEIQSGLSPGELVVVGPANNDLHEGQKIRYKLVQTALPLPAAAQTASFGPIVETVLPFGVACLNQLLQFRTGKIFTFGHGPATTQAEYEEDRKRADEDGGVDVWTSRLEEGLQFIGKGSIFTKEHSPNWNTATAETVLEQLKHASWTRGVVEPKTKDFPVTYLFRTARGECGIVQLLDVVEDERSYHGPLGKGYGLKLRYKLVQSTLAAATDGKAGVNLRRKFVRLVVDKAAMTFEGQPTTWDGVGALLEKVPERKNTVLECAVTSDQITVQQQNEWFGKCSALAHSLGFEYASFIGIHPLGSKGTPASIGGSTGATRLSAFGPVIERVVNSYGAEADNQGLDFESGAQFSIPERQLYNDELRMKWVIDHGIDLLVVNKGGIKWNLLGPGFKVARLSEEQWDQATPEKLPLALDAVVMETEDGWPFHAIKDWVEKPLAFAFQTGSGAIGLLRITGFTEKPLGVKLRYKLVQPQQRQAAGSTNSLESAHFTFDPTVELILPLGSYDKHFVNLGGGDSVTNRPMVEIKRAVGGDIVVKRDVGGDLIVAFHNQHAFPINFSIAGEGARQFWESTSADDLKDRYRRQGGFLLPFERNFVFPIQKKDLPMTFELPGAGILQVQEILDGDPPAVKLRYKLVRRETHDVPMVAILQAIKNSDATTFRDAFSNRIRRDDQQSDWGKNLQEAQAAMKEKFGDYQLSDFEFSFEGDDLKGKLGVSFKGKKQLAIAVVKEDGAWKLDER